MESKRLKEERGAIVHEMQELTKLVGEENRSFTNEETEKFDRLDEQQRELKDKVETLERVESVEVLTRNKPEVQLELGYNKRVTTDDKEQALRAFCLRASGNSITDAMAYSAEKCGVNLNSNSMSFKLTNRAQTIGTDSQGGHTASDSMVQGLEKNLVHFGGMRQVANVIRTATGNPIHYAYNADASTNVGSIIGENTSITNADLSFTRKTLGGFSYKSANFPVSLELLQDSEVPIAAFISEGLAESLSRIQNTHYTVGAGTTLPFGVMVSAAVGKVAASATALTYNELLDLYYSVDANYRTAGKFMCSDTVWSAIRKLVDGNGRPLVWSANENLGNGTSETLFGKQVVINNDVESTMAIDNLVMAFGDFKKYIIRDVSEIQVKVLNERYADVGAVGFVAYGRSDGLLINPNAVKSLKMAAA